MEVNRYQFYIQFNKLQINVKSFFGGCEYLKAEDKQQPNWKGGDEHYPAGLIGSGRFSLLDYKRKRKDNPSDPQIHFLFFNERCGRKS